MIDSTYCPDLWDGFTIDKKGNIFSCCLCKPAIFGNIYENKLSSIINCDEIKEYRKKSLNGGLSCYQKCNYVRKNNIKNKIDRPIEILYSDLRRLHVSFGEQCNIKCIMCKHPSNHANDPSILDYECLIRNVDIEPFEEIIIQGGEPLIIPECIKYLEFLASVKKKYILLTNGLEINDSMARNLVQNAKIVTISINAASEKVHKIVNVGSNFKTLINNISRLREYRDKLATNLKIYGRMTLTINNLMEIPSFLKKYHHLGFDNINFGYDRETVPAFLKNNEEFKINLQDKIKKELENANQDEIDLQRLFQLNLIRNHHNENI